MVQEEKSLLLKDLCTRLPYGVKVWYKYSTWHLEKFATSIRLANEKIALSHKFNKEGDWFPVEEAGEILIKPYLRSMSSMTEEEKKEFESFGWMVNELDDNYPLVHIGQIENVILGLNWLNVHHFDYCGLIEKGLAIEAPEGMYNKKN